MLCNKRLLFLIIIGFFQIASFNVNASDTTLEYFQNVIEQNRGWLRDLEYVGPGYDLLVTEAYPTDSYPIGFDPAAIDPKESDPLILLQKLNDLLEVSELGGPATDFRVWTSQDLRSLVGFLLIVMDHGEDGIFIEMDLTRQIEGEGRDIASEATSTFWALLKKSKVVHSIMVDPIFLRNFVTQILRMCFDSHTLNLGEQRGEYYFDHLRVEKGIFPDPEETKAQPDGNVIDAGDRFIPPESFRGTYEGLLRSIQALVAEEYLTAPVLILSVLGGVENPTISDIIWKILNNPLASDLRDSLASTSFTKREEMAHIVAITAKDPRALAIEHSQLMRTNNLQAILTGTFILRSTLFLRRDSSMVDSSLGVRLKCTAIM